MGYVHLRLPLLSEGERRGHGPEDLVPVVVRRPGVPRGREEPGGLSVVLDAQEGFTQTSSCVVPLLPGA